MLIKELINLWKVRAENILVYKGSLLKKFLKSKFKACPVNAGSYMAFKHHISFATDLAANFGVIDSESFKTLFQSFCAQ